MLRRRRPNARRREPPLQLEGIRVWDGLRARGACTIRWENDAIVALEPAGVERFPGLAVLPGLVDTHVHLVGNAGPAPQDFATWPLTTTREEQVLHGVAHAQRAMRAGVTTLRDLAGDEAQVAIRRSFEDGVLEGPRVLVHAVVGMTAGHADLFLPPAVAARKPTADGPDECRRLVRSWARAGVDGIKLTTSGGVLSMGDRSAWRNYTREEVAAVVDEAHALGLPVAAHAHSVEGIQVALDEGVDSIEHATQITEAQADLVARRKVPVAPTLLINEAIAEARVPVTAEAQAKAAALVAERDERFAYAARAGVDFVLGTDANGHHVDFGDQMAEVARMSQVLGYEPGRALVAATSAAAAALGLSSRVGLLAPGFGADLLVIRGRPWEQLGDLKRERLVAVVSRGRVVAGRLPGS